MSGRGRNQGADLPTIVGALRQSWALLSGSARRRYSLIVVAQMATSLLDLLGVALIGLTGVAAAAAVNGSQVSGLPGLERFSGVDPLQAAATLAVAAAIALLARSVAYSLLLRLNYRLLAGCQVEVTSSLLARFLQRPMTDIQQNASQTTAYALTGGAAAAVTGLLGSLSVVLTDTALLVLLGGGLLLVDPRAAVLSVVYLGLVALGVHKGLSKWSAVNGARLGAAGVSNVVAIQESVVLHRELLVLGRLGNQYERTRAGLETGARARATQSVIGQIPRIVYDAALVVGALLLAAWQLRTSTLAEALAVLLIFMAAASRIIPSLLRINGQLIQMRSAAAQSQLTFDLARRVAVPVAEGWQAPALATTHPAAPSEPSSASHLVVQGVTFTYPSGAGPVLHEVSLDAGPGTMLAIVGPTGGGKSTLADVVAGVIVPQSGTVTIDGVEPLARVAASPGSIGYVPQRVALVDGTVRDNVALALDRADVDDERVWAALREAQVGEVIEALDDGLDTRVGEHGLRLSGGQRQRLGIARALYSRPSLLILDEATSALDAETELAIARGLSTLRGTVTVVVIAHRLASVKTADQVVYLDHGRVAGAGTFESLSQSSEAFARQVEILSMPPRSATS